MNKFSKDLIILLVVVVTTFVFQSFYTGDDLLSSTSTEYYQYPGNTKAMTLNGF